MTLQNHIVDAFETDLRDLVQMVAEMGGRVEDLLKQSMEALLTHDIELAGRVRKADKEIDRNQHEVEERAIVVIAKRQPMAMDLREVIVSMRIASDLERIGDFAKNGAKRVNALDAGQAVPSVMNSLKRMGELCASQLANVLTSYVQKDEEQALEVWRRDSELDAIYNSIFRELLTYMMEKPVIISHCTHLLFIAKNLERIGDHATNIAESVFYLKTGELIGDDRPKGDSTSYTAVHPGDGTA